MSMQISVDPAALSQEQREAVAGFILAYPGKACAGTCGGHAVAEIPAFIHKDTADAGLVEIGRALDPEIAALVKDDGEFQASVAFGAPAGDPVAAAVFGSAPAPLPLGATAAPSIAVAAPSLTVPADTTATTFPGTLSAPLPPVSDAQTAFAPTAPAAPTTHAGGVDLDKHGLPWDGRIHTGTKRKNADGSWTAKRGVDPALVASVEAELRQVMGAPAAAPLASAPVAATVTAPAAVVAPPPPAPVAGAAPSMPAAPSAAPGEVPADARAQFVALVGRASAAIQGQKVTQAEVNQCCVDAGVPALPLLANRLDLVAQVAAHIDALIAARQ